MEFPPAGTMMRAASACDAPAIIFLMRSLWSEDATSPPSNSSIPSIFQFAVSRPASPSPRTPPPSHNPHLPPSSVLNPPLLHCTLLVPVPLSMPPNPPHSTAHTLTLTHTMQTNTPFPILSRQLFSHGLPLRAAELKRMSNQPPRARTLVRSATVTLNQTSQCGTLRTRSTRKYQYHTHHVNSRVWDSAVTAKKSNHARHVHRKQQGRARKGTDPTNVQRKERTTKNEPLEGKRG